MSLVEKIDGLLPQTQCGECGYPGCLPYAQALAQHQAPINLCAPGGVETLQQLGTLLELDPTPYLTASNFKNKPPALAYIQESECIGCTKCIQACPVDAIIGSATVMHSILASECTGCGLCVDPCPVDCIEMIPQAHLNFDKNKARSRFSAKQVRKLRDIEDQAKLYREKRKLATDLVRETDKQAKQAYILAALERAKAKKNGPEKM